MTRDEAYWVVGCIVAGPFVGYGVFMVLALVWHYAIGWLTVGFGVDLVSFFDWEFVSPGFLAVMGPFIYMLGFLPAALGSLAMIAVSRYVRTPGLRLLSALPVGAIATLPISENLFGGWDGGFKAVLIATGAITAVVAVALGGRALRG